MADPTPARDDPMATLRANPNPVYAGYTWAQLHDALLLVRNPENWKMSIDAVVPKDADVALIDAAIGFFTGGGAEVTEVEDGLRIQSEGYYVNIGP